MSTFKSHFPNLTVLTTWGSDPPSLCLLPHLQSGDNAPCKTAMRKGLMCSRLRTTSGCSKHCAGAAAVKGAVWREGCRVERTEHRRADRADRKTTPAARQAAVLRDTGWADQTSGGGALGLQGKKGFRPGEHGSICLRLAGWFWRKTKPRGHETESLT